MSVTVTGRVVYRTPPGHSVVICVQCNTHTRLNDTIHSISRIAFGLGFIQNQLVQNACEEYGGGDWGWTPPRASGMESEAPEEAVTGNSQWLTACVSGFYRYCVVERMPVCRVIEMN